MLARLNGKNILLSFGKYPAVSLQDARKKRLEAQELIAQGINPNEAKKAAKATEKARTENTFEKVARAWHNDKKSGWGDNTAAYILSRLEMHVFPAIGSLPIDEISPKQVIKVLKETEAKGINETAKRNWAVISRIFKYAIQHLTLMRFFSQPRKSIMQPSSRMNCQNC